jgi:HupE / UreJ protein
MILRNSFFIGLLLFFVGSVSAHKPSDAFMTVEPLSIRLSVALKDLDAAIETIDENEDRKLTFAEFKAATSSIEALIQKEVSLRCGVSPLNLRWRIDESSQSSALEKRNDGTYVRLTSGASCHKNEPIQLQYRLFETIDTSHRLLITNQLGAADALQVTAPSEKFVQLRSDSAALIGAAASTKTELSIVATLLNFVIEGFTHLAIGWDHLAFILVLVLPFTLWRMSKKAYTLDWICFKRLIFVVSAFTVGHCITLVLVTLNLVQITGQWVEPTIALTIVISAALNLMPDIKAPRLLLALAFGTIHGLGFSSVLSELDISAGSRLAALVGFNIGIELGQIVFVMLWALAQYWLIRWNGYRRWVLMLGSTVLMLGAVVLVIFRTSA